MAPRAGGSLPSEPSSSPPASPDRRLDLRKVGMNGASPGSLTLLREDSDKLHTTAVVPVKGLTVANGRLDGLLSAQERSRIAEALFLDLILKLPKSSCIDDVLVVTADRSIARQARWFGAKVLMQDADEGHSEAATAGA